MGICCRFLFCLIALPALALEPPVLIVDQQQRIDLTPYASVLNDPSRQLSLAEILENPPKYPFKAITAPYLRTQSVKTPLWIKLRLRSNSDEQQHRILHIARQPISDHIQFYESLNNNEFRPVQTGRHQHWQQRDIASHSFAFNVNLAPKQEKTIYLVFTEDRSRRIIPLYLKSPEEFNRFLYNWDKTATIFYAIIITLFIYNLLLWIKLRENAQLYYLTYIFVFAAAFITGDGVAHKLISLYQLSPNILPPNALALFSTLTNLFHMLFVFNVLNLATVKPALGKLLKLIIGIQIALMLAFVTDSISGNLSYLGSINFIVGWVISIAFVVYGFIKKLPSAASLLLAEFSISFGSVVFLAASFGVGVVNHFTLFVAGKTAFIFQLILYSLVLGDRARTAIKHALEQENKTLATQAATLEATTKTLELTAEKEKNVVVAQQKAIDAYQENLKLKNDFISAISHELRTPMHGIIGALQVMQKHPEEQLKPPLNIVQSSATAMMDLVNDILIHTEIQADKINIQIENVDISRLLLELRLHYQQQCLEKDLQLHWEISRSMPHYLGLDGEKTTTIISKLLDNAIKFTHQGRVAFELGFDPSAHQLVCCVSDTGIGIDESQQQKIFESFAQSDTGFDRNYGGLGIGLSICKQLTEKLGGELQLHSHPQHGSTFTVLLPAQQVKVLPRLNKEGLANAQLPILVVEDNVTNQKIIEKLLQKIGYQVLIAQHGQAALEILQQQPAALILMDLQMPVMDGFSCTRQIRQQSSDYQHIPIIAVTANMMDADKQRCFECGMNDFLKKPVKLGTLRQTLLNYIEPSNDAAAG